MKTSSYEIPSIDFDAAAFVPSDREFFTLGKLALMCVEPAATLVVTPEEMEAFEAASLLTTLAIEIFGF